MARDPDYGAELPPRIVLPPTVLFASAAVQWALARWVPVTALPAWSDPAATALAVAGATVALLAVVRFQAEGTSVHPFTTADALLTGGIYQVSRNPIYLGMALLSAAFGLKLGAASPLAVTPVLMVALDRIFIRREEVYLERRFGADYRAYRQRVRRWL